MNVVHVLRSHIYLKGEYKNGRHPEPTNPACSDKQNQHTVNTAQLFSTTDFTVCSDQGWLSAQRREINIFPCGEYLKTTYAENNKDDITFPNGQITKN